MTHRLPLLAMLSALSLISTACANDEAETDGALSPEEMLDTSLDELLSALPHFELSAAQPKTEVACDALCPPSGQQSGMFCSYNKFTETAHLSDFVALQPNSATLWPGTVVRGDDARAGMLTPLSAPLGEVTFSLSLENLAGSPVGQMSEPSLSAFREVRNGLLAQGVTGATPAALQFDMMEVHNASQLAIAIGAGVDWPGSGEVAASFDFASQSDTTKLVVNFTQAYYTIDVDTKSKPSDFFAPGTVANDLAGEVSPESPPLYVQSITYGRRVIFTVETEDSAEAISGALQAAYGGVVNGSLSVAAAHQETLSKSNIQAFVLGGSGAAATGVIEGVDGLMQYIAEGGNYSSESPGAPIAYKLAYLDNAVTELAFTTDYAEKTCVKNEGAMRVSLEGITHVAGGDLSGGMEIYGQIGIRFPGPEDNGSCAEGTFAQLWYANSGSWVGVPKYGTWYPTNPPSIYLPKVGMGDGKRVCLLAALGEHDPIGGNDVIGSEAKLISWEQGWEGAHKLSIMGDGNTQVDLTISIELD